MLIMHDKFEAYFFSIIIILIEIWLIFLKIPNTNKAFA